VFDELMTTLIKQIMVMMIMMTKLSYRN